MSEALFRLEAGRYLPTDRSRGPWSPDALHGSPVAALLAHVVEQERPAGRTAQADRYVGVSGDPRRGSLERRDHLVDGSHDGTLDAGVGCVGGRAEPPKLGKATFMSGGSSIPSTPSSARL